eukprot:GEMP01007174.1.p1 GENE.GEMP01007174.1~~GEMP01007174.1.p1  ORF type:complete len:562 (+),score=88.35 GEMP01007174.1:211-1896(+)
MFPFSVVGNVEDLIYDEKGSTLQFEFGLLIGLCLLWIILIKEMTRCGKRNPEVAPVCPASPLIPVSPMAASDCRKELLFDAARRSKMEMVKRILDSMHQNNCLGADTIASVFRVLMARKMTWTCLELYNKYQVDDLIVMRIVLACAVEERRTKQAMEIFDKIGDQANLRDWHTLMRTTKHSSNRYVDAIEILERMKKSNVAPDISIHLCVYHICLQNGQFEKAEELLPLLGNEVVHYNTMMRAFSEVNRLSDTMRMFRLIKENELQPTAVSYGTVLHACVSANELTRAKEFVQEMRDNNIELNTIHQTTLIKGLCRERHIEDAMEMFETMKNPDLVTYSTLIKALVDCQRVEEAYKLTDRLEAVPNMQLDEIVYNSLLLGCAYSGDVRLAHETFERMQKKGVKPSAATVSTLLKMYSKMKMWDEAIASLANLHKYDIMPEPRLFRQVVLGLCRRRQGRRVIEVYHLFRACMAKTATGHVPRESNGEILAACVHFNLTDTTRTLISIMANMNELVPVADLDLARELFHRRPAKYNGSDSVENMGLFVEISILRRKSIIFEKS